MSKFKVGDVVKHKGGKAFSNGDYTATVGPWVFSLDSLVRVALVETNTHVMEDKIKLADDGPIRETTVVKKEIIPGEYGCVKISLLGGIFVYDLKTTEKTKLLDTIKTLQIIYDAMV